MKFNLTILEIVMIVLGVGTYGGIRVKNALVSMKRLTLVMVTKVVRIYCVMAVTDLVVAAGIRVSGPR